MQITKSCFFFLHFSYNVENYNFSISCENFKIIEDSHISHVTKASLKIVNIVWESWLLNKL